MRYVLLSVAVSALALASPLDAQSCSLACDINKNVGKPLASLPRSFVRCGSLWFFVARTTPADGEELWKTDGTPAGTVMVKNLPGRSTFTISFLTCCNGKVFFRGGTSQHGFEPWVSDGTPAGTFMLKDIRSGTLSSYPARFACVGSKVVFTADDGVSRQTLWVTDGTSAGTRRLGVAASIIDMHTSSAGTKAYFSTSTGLFATDGTAAGSHLVKSVGLGSRFVNFNGKTYFSARDTTHGFELWVTDGTSAGTFMVKDIRPGNASSNPFGSFSGAAVLGAKLYFGANDGVTGQELWETDGTAAGTKRTADIVSGSGGSSPKDLFPDSGALYFAAQVISGSSPTGRELYRLAGGSVRLVKDINPGPGSGLSFTSAGFVSLGNGKVLFSADDGTHGFEPWVTDGTPAGTQLARDVNAGSANGGGVGLARLAAGRVLFQGDDGKTGSELFESDGTAAGTKLFKDLMPGGLGFSSTPSVITAAWGSTVYMAADDGVHGKEPWVYDAVGGCRVLEVVPGSQGGFPSSFVPCWTGRQALVFFTANDRTHGAELWVTDGTPAGTRLARDVRPGPFESSIKYMVACNGKLVFTANDGVSGAEPWVSDGTPAGTVRLADLNPGSSASFIRGFVCVDGTAYFGAYDGKSAGLYRTDGTPAGTVRVADTGASDLARFGDRVVFQGDTTSSGSEPWISDGTKAGTKQIKDVRPGSRGSAPAEFTVCGGQVYFRADDGTHGSELWVTDGTAGGTRLVKDLRPGLSRSSPRNLTCCAGKLFFFASTGVGTHSLWTSDGTAGGTRLVKSFRFGTPWNVISLGDELFFMDDNGLGSGTAIWRSDGTAGGTTTMMCGPVAPRVGSLAPAGGVLYFAGSTLPTGTELFRITEPAAMVETLGQGCPPAFPSLTASVPALGGTLVLTSRRGPSGHVGFLAGAAPIARPVVAPFSGPCALWLDLSSLVAPIGAASTAPSFTRSLPIPNSKSLKGGGVVFQTLWLNASTLFPVQTSNGVRTTVGI